MTNQALAKIHFPSDEDPLEQYAHKIFEFKQFYFQRNPIPKVCSRKIEQLKAIHEAFVFRFPEISVHFNPIPEECSDFSSFLAEDFLILEARRAKFRSQISRSQHALEIAKILEFWFDVEASFARKYAAIHITLDLAQINLSQNTDAMSLNAELKKIQEPLSLDYLQANKSNLSPKINEELQRCAKFVQVNADM